MAICELADFRSTRGYIFENHSKRFSKTNKLAKNDKILIRDKAIIEQEIHDFDKRLYDDLTCGKYDYGYLRRLVAGRKKAKADWHQTLSRYAYHSYHLCVFLPGRVNTCI